MHPGMTDLQAILGSRSHIHQSWVSTAGTEGLVTVRLHNFKQSVTFLEDLKSSSIGSASLLSDLQLNSLYVRHGLHDAACQPVCFGHLSFMPTQACLDLFER